MSRRRHGRRPPEPGAPAQNGNVASQPQGRPQAENDGILDRLGVHPGMTVCLMNPPEGFYSKISNHLPSTCRLYLGFPPKPPAHMFVLWPDGTRQNLETSLGYLRTMLAPEGAIWVAVARRSGSPRQQGQPVQRPPGQLPQGPRPQGQNGAQGQGLSMEEVLQAGQSVGMVENKRSNLADSHQALRLVPRRLEQREGGPPRTEGRPSEGAEQR